MGRSKSLSPISNIDSSWSCYTVSFRFMDYCLFILCPFASFYSLIKLNCEPRSWPSLKWALLVLLVYSWILSCVITFYALLFTLKPPSRLGFPILQLNSSSSCVSNAYSSLILLWIFEFMKLVNILADAEIFLSLLDIFNHSCLYFLQNFKNRIK